MKFLKGSSIVFLPLARNVIGVIIAMVIFGVVMAFPVMWCWNALIPYLFGLPTLTWFRAWCLYLLCAFLFKTFGGLVNENGISDKS